MDHHHRLHPAELMGNPSRLLPSISGPADMKRGGEPFPQSHDQCDSMDFTEIWFFSVEMDNMCFYCHKLHCQNETKLEF